MWLAWARLGSRLSNQVRGLNFVSIQVCCKKMQPSVDAGTATGQCIPVATKNAAGEIPAFTATRDAAEEGLMKEEPAGMLVTSATSTIVLVVEVHHLEHELAV